MGSAWRSCVPASFRARHLTVHTLAPSPLPNRAQARCQLYATARQLLVAAGVGAVRELSPALLQAAAAELYGRRQEGGGAADGSEGPARKKARKGQAAAAGDLASEAAAGGPHWGVSQRLCREPATSAAGVPACTLRPAAAQHARLTSPSPLLPLPATITAAPLDGLGSAAQARDLVVQAAALRALEALCAAGAPLLAPAQRRQLDDLAAHVAATAAAAAERLASDAEAAVGAGLAGLQLAAYRLLLASLLAPAPSRPRHLAAGLRLFRDGSAGGGAPALSAFCRQVRCTWGLGWGARDLSQGGHASLGAAAAGQCPDARHPHVPPPPRPC